MTELSGIPISSELYVDVEENLDIMMARIIKRKGKWVEWTTKRSWIKGAANQASPVATMPTSSQSATAGMTIASTQGPAQLAGGGDQPPNKNVPIVKAYHDGSLLVIGTPTRVEEKKMEEPKDRMIASIPFPHVTLVPSPHVSPIYSPDTTPIPSPHHRPILPKSATFLQPSGSSI